MRVKLRTKMMIFAVSIAVLPLLISGQSIIRVAQDELKSAANEQIAATAQQITAGFETFFAHSIFTPLDLIRNSLGSEAIGSKEKIFLLQQGIADLEDVVSLQVNVEGVPHPIIVAQQDYSTRLSKHYENPLETLKLSGQDVSMSKIWREGRVKSVVYMDRVNDWLATVGLKIPNGIGGRPAVLHARIKLNALEKIVSTNRFSKIGQIHVANEAKEIIFGTSTAPYDHSIVMGSALEKLKSKTATISIGPYTLDDGSVSLAALSVPRPFPWVIIVEKAEADAYRPIYDMIRSLVRWLAIGMAAAMIGAFIFSLALSRPILKIGQAAIQIANGNLNSKVVGVRNNDEIGDLAQRFNTMIVQLQERFELQKFVSKGTMRAIQSSDGQEVSLGGERRRVAILFADIRGYTAFSESREPEEVVAVLNSYFQQITNIVVSNHGDIDKFVGDEVMAVFSGANETKHAIECAIAIMDAMESMTADSGADLRIGIGINVGDVVAGAMGSLERKDFTVLGDHVNLAARLCGKAAPDETLVTQDCMDALPKKLSGLAKKQPPMKVKGKVQDVQTYAFYCSEQS